MNRDTSFYLPAETRADLAVLAKVEGLTLDETVTLAIDTYIDYGRRGALFAVVSAMLKSPAPMTRLELCAETGLPLTTMRRGIELGVSKGVVEFMGVRRTGMRGMPPKVWGLPSLHEPIGAVVR